MLKFLIFFCLIAGVFCGREDNIAPINEDDEPIPSARRPSSLPCPYGWKYVSEYSLCLYVTPSLTWHDAEQYCTNRSAHLISVHGRDLLPLASQMVVDWFWTGLYKYNDDKEDTWKFTNNEPVNYVPWGNTANSRCALARSDFVYQHVECNLKYFGICQVYAYS